ncbi:MAG: adenosylcobinamide-phosphate synthase CbiB [Bacillota bacterium]
MEMIVLSAVLLDLIMGDPRWLPHPVVYIGKTIARAEGIIRSITNTPAGLKMAGCILVFAVVLGTYGFYWLMLWLAFKISNWLGVLLSIFVLSQAIAVKSLYQHAMQVAVPLKAGDLNGARQALAMIVGRDTHILDESEITRGVVETVSENTVDGITAPLFYAFIGGPALAMAYKAVNTLDSMIGYKDERYLYLGWAGARLDDLANYLPARITGLLYLLAAPFTPGGLKGVWNTIISYARRHPSPNSGIPEAAVAGALQVQLGGTNYYRGAPSYRAVMGEAKRPLEFKDIYRSIYIMFAVTALTLVFGLLLLNISRGILLV